ncbi:unnamed protein product [Candida verbasci]|uniref:triacylglycerol lipase n=1 Tax=Candida verbasci TaxID=1227364 RepID=A0A9W4TXQ2_9ASCO|nr:unnamed protein product [Candida verbasci]
MKLILQLLFLLSICQGSDYTKLVQFANLATVSYCVTKGLKIGLLGNKETNCAIKACKNHFLQNVEIVKIFDFNRLNEVGTGYYAVDNTRKTIILVFRGSASTRDWVTNVNFTPITYTPIVYDEKFEGQPYYLKKCINCKVHRGFYNFLKDNSGAIIQAGIKLKSQYPDYQFLIIGHSLGAALTVMSGIEFQLLGYEPLVVTFGGPRVGNQEFADFADNIFDTEEVTNTIHEKKDFNHGLIRVVHGKDFIPYLPPMFVHAGFEYNIDKKDLPHLEEDLNRNLNEKRSFNPSNIKPSSLWPSRLGKYEHTHYFRKITSCKG